MTEEQQTLKAIESEIANLSTADLALVTEVVERLRTVLAGYPGGHAAMAIALIGAQLAAR